MAPGPRFMLPGRAPVAPHRVHSVPCLTVGSPSRAVQHTRPQRKTSVLFCPQPVVMQCWPTGQSVVVVQG
jgi:hypothetical protein